MSEPKWLSIGEAAIVWNVAPITVHRWIKQGRIKAYKLGPRKVRLRAEDVEALPTPVQKDEAGMIESMGMLISASLEIPRMTEEQARIARESEARIDENMARIKARSGVHGPSWELINRERDERSEYLEQVMEESNAEMRRRKEELGGR